jgi:DNA repair protein RecO (recombination protein O)
VSIFSTSAVLLRRIQYADSDLILTFLTRDSGKLSAIAKSPKSVKPWRRSGAFQRAGHRLQQASTGLPILKKQLANCPYPPDIIKTSYASYWSNSLCWKRACPTSPLPIVRRNPGRPMRDRPQMMS